MRNSQRTLFKARALIFFKNISRIGTCRVIFLAFDELKERLKTRQNRGNGYWNIYPIAAQTFCQKLKKKQPVLCQIFFWKKICSYVYYL